MFKPKTVLGLGFLAVSPAAMAYSVTISGQLPDPSSGNTYCVESAIPINGNFQHFKFNVSSTGGGSTTHVAAVVRYYTENYDGSMSYLNYCNGLWGELSWGTGDGTNSMSVDDDIDTGQSDPTGNDQNTIPTYVIYGVKVMAYLETSTGTILASTSWTSWNNGGIKLHYSSGTASLVSGWYTFHNSTQNYGPPNQIALRRWHRKLATRKTVIC